ncbi:putative acyltransferase [Pseudomonas asplenii]|uniref:Putative acyltransferase n=3 Tax=Pseudomonas asplenii TaxID=53407 RepID=A0A0M9GHC4_9PSED|nr:putative acyltransferase [Pseudomonas fuscovaginae]KPA95136.1 putative acyltransferase [Pseudomonas fuscovaginae]
MNRNEVMLDNPTWHALTGRQRELGEGGCLARRYLPAVSPFAAVASPSPEAFQALGRLIGETGPVLMQTISTCPPLEALPVQALGEILQMVAIDPPASVDEKDLQCLGPADTAAMLQLAQQTRPGPFGQRTGEMGRYIGLRDQGRLIAMAGERMRLDGFIEISAVCVDEAYRGRGLAARLMNSLRRDILRRGDLPFLHVFSHNRSAVSLYRRLGFETRQVFSLWRIGCTADPSAA